MLGSVSLSSQAMESEIGKVKRARGRIDRATRSTADRQPVWENPDLVSLGTYVTAWWSTFLDSVRRRLLLPNFLKDVASSAMEWQTRVEQKAGLKGQIQRELDGSGKPNKRSERDARTVNTL